MGPIGESECIRIRIVICFRLNPAICEAADGVGFGTGAHHAWIEFGRCLIPHSPRSRRVCQKCTWGNTMEDTYHALFTMQNDMQIA
jgi:hypothetical protein